MKARKVACCKMFEMFKKNEIKFFEIVDRESRPLENYILFFEGYTFSFLREDRNTLLFSFFENGKVVFQSEVTYKYNFFKGLYLKYDEHLNEISDDFFVKKIYPIFEKIEKKFEEPTF